MVPSSDTLSIASAEDATTAARWALAISACLRSSMSRTTPIAYCGTPCASRTGTLLTCAQVTRPSLRTKRFSIV